MIEDKKLHSPLLMPISKLNQPSFLLRKKSLNEELGNTSWEDQFISWEQTPLDWS